jgi:DNA-directed RNA polymerase specialized sigma24 family protein
MKSQEAEPLWSAEEFRELFDREAPKILGWLVRVVGSRPAADKLLEEIFEEAWLHPERCLRKSRSPLFFLLCMARERARDHLRERSGPIGQAIPGAV